ncbi:MAG: Si-specific NAD(P)(+) transhydrogenase [Zetaproteobacteria bacterium]|nr:Si-specific NAD(P)(+) transhydrogenase [Pseudobdellovibrionaceae bacterium]
MKSFDLVVIGSGPAGEKAAVKAAYFGYQVALIEKEKLFGGAGVNTGTIPSKTLKETSLYYSGKYTKGLFGDDYSAQLDNSVQKFLYREQVVCEAVEHEVKTNLKHHNVSIFSGLASFEDEHHIRIMGVKEEVIQSDHIIIATGSYPFHPPGIPFDFLRVHDSNSILTIKRFPKSICIVGAGVIGCEYATIFANLGIHVSLINKQSNILGFLDDEISANLIEQMEKSGVDIIVESEVAQVQIPELDDQMIDVSLSTGETLHVDMFLYAAGRCGSTGSLKCDKAGVALGARETISVNEKYQTSVPHIYAIGDVIGFPALASTSMDQGRVAVAHIFNTKDLDSVHKTIPYGIYTIPEVSMVGLSEQDAGKKGIDYCVGRAHHSKMVRGRIMGLEEGMIKIIFERANKKIIGVHIVGHLASELIHFGLTLVESEKTLLEVIAIVFNFPTLHDLYKYACYDGLGNLSGHKIKTD